MKILLCLVVFALSSASAYAQEFNRYVIKWDKNTAYVSIDGSSQLARVVEYEGDKLAVYYSSRCFMRNESNAVNLVSIGQVVWGPMSKEWLPDSFFIVPEAENGIVYDDGHVQKQAKVARGPWMQIDNEKFAALESGFPK